MGLRLFFTVFFFFCSQVTAKPLVRPSILYIGTIKCLEKQDIVPEIINAAIKDCDRYKMNAVFYMQSVDLGLCEGDTKLVTVYFAYQCSIKKEE